LVYRHGGVAVAQECPSTTMWAPGWTIPATAAAKPSKV
jgi:hypothetical protein